MGISTPAAAALALAAGLLVAACTAESPTDPVPLEAAFAKPACPGHPSCGGDDDEGGDDPAGTTALLSGGYNEDPDATPQPVNVGVQGRIRSISETSSGVRVAFLVPPFADELAFTSTCIHNGFGSDAEAMAFWNDIADDGVAAHKFLARMDTRNMESNDTDHLHEIVWDDSKDIPEGNLTKFRVGNHSDYGAARWSASGDTYTITEGGLKLSVLGGDGNHELVGVTCDNASAANGGLGASFTIDLQ